MPSCWPPAAWPSLPCSTSCSDPGRRIRPTAKASAAPCGGRLFCVRGPVPWRVLPPPGAFREDTAAGVPGRRARRRKRRRRSGRTARQRASGLSAVAASPAPRHRRTGWRSLREEGPSPVPASGSAGRRPRAQAGPCPSGAHPAAGRTGRRTGRSSGRKKTTGCPGGGAAGQRGRMF